MTEEERDGIKEEILEQLKYDSSLIEDLTPVTALKEDDKFEIHGARSVSFARLCSEIRLQATLDQYRHVDRGQWEEGQEYYAGDLNPYSGLYEVSHVWYYGCKYRCLVTGTPNPPRYDSPDWEFEEGNPFLTLQWTSPDSSVYEDNPQLTLEVSASIYNQDVTDEPRVKWDWSRESYRDGVRDTASDDIWNAAHENTGSNAQSLVMEDMNYQFNTRPDSLVFRVTATLLDDAGVPAKASDGSPITESMVIEI